jgi:beta-N-acetylhexosaminidase
MRTTVLSILLGLLYIVPAFAADAADPSALPPERLAAQMVMAGFRGMHARDADLLDEIRQGLVGGVVLFDKDLSLDGAPRNIRDADQVRSLVAGLQAALPPDAPPLLVAVDQEGGRVMRLKPQYGFPDLPAAKELGTQSPDASRRAGAVAGRTLADLGVNVNFAPVVDVDANPHSPAIGALGRSFSADPGPSWTACWPTGWRPA